MKKGFFVTIEGCEGVGKSTLLRGLEDYLETAGREAVFTREPGGTEVAERIRAVILDPENAAMTPTAELLLYAAARAQHTEEKIIPAVRDGKLVICDRYSDSTLAYQSYARGLDRGECLAADEIARRGVKPDLTVFLDLSPERGFARKGGADKGDRLEREKIDFHERVYAGFRAIAESDPDRVVAVDASKSKEEVLAAVVSLLKERGMTD